MANTRSADVTGGAAGRSRRPSRRQRVIDTLAQHGLSERTAPLLYRLGTCLRRRMLIVPTPAQRVEHAGMADALTAQRLGVVGIGTHDGVDIDPQLDAARGNRAASVHTHPGSSSVSPDDVPLLLAGAVLDVVTVIGTGGSWYALSAVRGAPTQLAALVRPLYDATVHTLLLSYRILVYAGAMSEEQAWRELTHRTWQTLAPSFRLRQDRLT